jgi:ATP-binding cassette subfamily F protein uup
MELADDSLYARDPKRFAQAAAELAQRRAELTAAEDRWLEIEALREEIERSS